MLSFLHAVRIAVDFRTKNGVVVDVSQVRLTIFGKPGDRSLKKSIGGSPRTSWYIDYDEDEDLSNVTVDDVVGDPVHHDVVYLVFEDEEVAQIPRLCLMGETVLDYVKLVVTNKVRGLQKTGHKRSRDFDPEVYFFDVLKTVYAPAFMSLLRSPLEGFDKDGIRLDGTGVKDNLLLLIEQEENFDKTSSTIYISKRTKRLKRTLKLKNR